MPRWLLCFAGFAIVAIAGLAALALLQRQDETVGWGREIQFDDFAFSVLEARKDPADSAWDVRLRIDNHAKRVPFRFRRDTIRLVDASDACLFPRSWEALAPKQAEEAVCSEEIPAGSSCSTTLRFELPAEVATPELYFSFGGKFCEALDLVFLGRKRIRL